MEDMEPRPRHGKDELKSSFKEALHPTMGIMRARTSFSTTLKVLFRLLNFVCDFLNRMKSRQV